MNKFFILNIIAMLFSANLFAQNIVDFELPLPAAKVPGSLYSTFKFIDSRPDTSNLGFVQTGFFNRRGTVTAKTPLVKQLTGLFYSIADTTGSKPEMLLQLRQFSFAEVTAGMSEKGFLSFRANLYAHNAGVYQQVKSADTVYVLKSSIDVTQSLLSAGRQALSDFLMENIATKASGPVYSYRDILQIDSVEKFKIKLYNTITYVDGLYLNYQSFMNQAPDKQVTADGFDLNMATIKTTGDNGKPQKVKPAKVYAIVFKGLPYISCRGVYYPLKKDNGEFLFTGKAQVSANNGDVIVAGAMFGILGSMLASNAEATFEMKIDHLSGRFIRLKEIPEVVVAESY